MYKKLKEKINIILVTKPRHVVLLIILLLNIILISGAAVVISLLAPADIEGGFWPSIFYTISMILEEIAGYKDPEIEDFIKANI